MGIFQSDGIEFKKARIKELAGAALNLLIMSVKQSYDMIWKSEDHTPQEMFDSFGSDAAQLLLASSETQKLIKKLKPDYQYLKSPNSLTINEDGTVVVGDPIEE